MRNNDARTRLGWQRKMLIAYFGWPVNKPVPAANPWQELEVYGGYKSIEEWRKKTPGIRTRIVEPPFVPFPILTETEIRGECTVDQTKDTSEVQGDSLEEQAIQHGASFSLKGLKRPDKIISTVEQLREAHPDHDPDPEQTNSVFSEFLKTQKLPTNEECTAMRAERERIKKATRKRKKPAAPKDPTKDAQEKKLQPKTTKEPPKEQPKIKKPPPKKTQGKRIRPKKTKRVTISDEREEISPPPLSPTPDSLVPVREARRKRTRRAPTRGH